MSGLEGWGRVGCDRVEGVNFNISAIRARAQLESKRKNISANVSLYCPIKFSTSFK